MLKYVLFILISCLQVCLLDECGCPRYDLCRHLPVWNCLKQHTSSLNITRFTHLHSLQRQLPNPTSSHPYNPHRQLPNPTVTNMRRNQHTALERSHSAPPSRQIRQHNYQPSDNDWSLNNQPEVTRARSPTIRASSPDFDNVPGLDHFESIVGNFLINDTLPSDESLVEMQRYLDVLDIEGQQRSHSSN